MVSSEQKKKKKKTIIYLIGGILVIVGIGTVACFAWQKNKSTENEEPTNLKQQIQQLKTELNSLKNRLNNLSNTTQKTQLENKLSNLESQINNLFQSNNSLPTQPTLKKLVQEIKQIQQELDKKPDKPNSPTDPNQLQFTVYYYVTLGRNHMWIDYDDKSDRIILIDKENPIFSGNSKLTKKNHRYTITFSPQDAEKYPNSHDHVYYFSKNNHKFSLVPISTSPPNNPNNKKESKFEYRIFFKEGNSGYYSFQNVFPDIPKKEWKIIHINQDHPQIKELVSQGKLEKHKLFTIHYGKADEETNNGLIVTFNEFNEELEIVEV